MSTGRCGGGLRALRFETMRTYGVADCQPQITTLPVRLRRSLRTSQILSRPPPMNHRRDHVFSLASRSIEVQQALLAGCCENGLNVRQMKVYFAHHSMAILVVEHLDSLCVTSRTPSSRPSCSGRSWLEIQRPMGFALAFLAGFWEALAGAGEPAARVGPVAQSVEQATFNREVAGSSPAGPTTPSLE